MLTSFDATLGFPGEGPAGALPYHHTMHAIPSSWCCRALAHAHARARHAVERHFVRAQILAASPRTSWRRWCSGWCNTRRKTRLYRSKVRVLAAMWSGHHHGIRTLTRLWSIWSHLGLCVDWLLRTLKSRSPCTCRQRPWCRWHGLSRETSGFDDGEALDDGGRGCATWRCELDTRGGKCSTLCGHFRGVGRSGCVRKSRHLMLARIFRHKSRIFRHKFRVASGNKLEASQSR
jgi:hypothetical protein